MEQMKLFGVNPSKPKTWREKHKEVLSSKRWTLLREKFLEKTGCRCQSCGWEQTKWHKAKSLQLHHLTYERLGSESDADVELLCTDCHQKADRQRQLASSKRSSDALRNAQFNGWAEKVYGEDYHEVEDEYMHDKFDAWKERKDEYEF